MPRKKQQQKSQRISGLEALLGTDAYRKGMQGDLERDAEGICKILEASAVLLEYQSDRLANREPVTNTLSEAVSELLGQQVCEVKILLRRAKRSAELVATVPLKEAEVLLDPRLTKGAS